MGVLACVNCLVLNFVLFLFRKGTSAEVVALTDANIDTILNSNEIAIVNFYADWCRFSQILKPTFEEAGTKSLEEFPNPGKVVFAKVDADAETNIAGKYRINKYPTIKLFRGGQPVKKEYRGQRSVDALVQFAKDQSKDSVEEITNLGVIHDFEYKKRHIVGYFDSNDSGNYKLFAKAASVLRDECLFHAAFGEVAADERPIGDSIKAHFDADTVIQYTNAVSNYDALLRWAQESCTPLVREITFENAEELTEEGLPFVILFYNPDDTNIVERYKQVVASQLMHEKEAKEVNVNFLSADGNKFAHPLHHLGKSVSDLPLLCIDSFRHMYLFPGNVEADLEKPGVLRQFVEDLHSGKLHREFHHGPDPTQPPAPPQIEDGGDQDDQPDTEQPPEHHPRPPSQPEELPADVVTNPPEKNIPREASEPPKVEAPKKITSPPESTFRKLRPSGNRYTILRDEL